VTSDRIPYPPPLNFSPSYSAFSRSGLVWARFGASLLAPRLRLAGAQRRIPRLDSSSGVGRAKGRQRGHGQGVDSPRGSLSQSSVLYAVVRVVAFGLDSRAAVMRLIGRAVMLTISLILAPLTVEGQPPAKMPRIGVLSGGTPTTYAARHEAFRQGLRELGYVEGKNVVLEYRYAEGKPERLSGLAAELVRLNVDLILTYGEPQIHAAKQATHDPHRAWARWRSGGFRVRRCIRIRVRKPSTC
jgi:hypothetical protein